MIVSKIRSLRWADFYLYSLVDPRALCRLIEKNDPRPFALSFTVPALVALVDIVALSLLSKQSAFFYTKITYGWILFFIYSSVKIVITAALMDTLSQFLGHQGRIRDLISLFNYALFPQALLLPLIYIFVIVNFAPLFFYMFISLALFFWSLSIIVTGISEMHSISPGRSLLIVLFPWLFLGAAFFFIIFLSLVALMGYFV